MPTLTDDFIRQLHDALDEDAAPHNRASAWRNLTRELEDLGAVIAREMLADGNTMRQVSEWTGVPLGTAQRRWGHFNPRART